MPDDVDLVSEAAAMMAVFAAQRLERVDRLRRNALADAGTYGNAVADVVERSVRLEVAAALRITEHSAGMLLATAEALVERYPEALDSLSRAAITEQHAHTLANLLDGTTTDVRDRILPRAVELAEQSSTGTFRRGLRRLIEREEAATLAARLESAVTQRRVVVEPADDGMAWLHALIPAVEAHAIHNRLTAIGKAIKARPDEERTLDQLRADAFGDLLVDGDTSAIPPEGRGIRATVAVTVPALSLLDAPSDSRGSALAGVGPQGADHRGPDQWGPDSPGAGPDRADSQRADPLRTTHPPALDGVPVVEGLGPIPVHVARDLCAGADGWMRVLTHPETGVVLSVGRTQYRPPPSLRRLIRWRSGRCMAPGCGIPASRCEIDHTVAWEHGGPTSAQNLAPLCKGHHTVKHHGGWTVEQVEGSSGALNWVSRRVARTWSNQSGTSPPSGRRRTLARRSSRAPVLHSARSPSTTATSRRAPRAPLR